MQKAAAVATPKKPTPLAVIGLCCLVVALALQAGGVATREWVVTSAATYGLWQYCVSDSCSGHPDAVLTVEFQATRALSILGVLLAAMSCSVGVVLICIKERVVSLSAGILAVLAAVCITAAFVVMLTNIDLSDYGFSFYLTIAASILALAGGICFIVNGMLGRGQKPANPYN